MPLTQAIVAQLRALKEARLLDVKAAAQAHNVGRETIRRALRGETFVHVPQAKALVELDNEAAASEARFLAMLEQDAAKRATAAQLSTEAQDIAVLPPKPLDEGGPLVPDEIKEKARRLLGET